MNKIQILKLFENYKKKGLNNRDSLDMVIEYLYSRNCYNMQSSKVVRQIKEKYKINFFC